MFQHGIIHDYNELQCSMHENTSIMPNAHTRGHTHTHTHTHTHINNESITFDRTTNRTLRNKMCTEFEVCLIYIEIFSVFSVIRCLIEVAFPFLPLSLCPSVCECARARVCACPCVCMHVFEFPLASNYSVLPGKVYLKNDQLETCCLNVW